MELWISHSNCRKQIVLAGVSAVVGLVLMLGFNGLRGYNTNAMAGFLLGVLLLVIGVIAMLMSGSETVVVDPNTRRVTVENSNLFGKKKRSILFSDIEDINVTFFGKKSNYITYYYLALSLRNGENYQLFAPGRYYRVG
jgi:hypothetical protein